MEADAWHPSDGFGEDQLEKHIQTPYQAPGLENNGKYMYIHVYTCNYSKLMEIGLNSYIMRYDAYSSVIV